MRAAIFTMLGLTACSFSPSGGAAGGDDGGRIDAAIIDGAEPIDAPAVAVDACASVCVAGNVESCGFIVEACGAGCSTSGGVHCKQLVPSNGVTAGDLTGADADVALLANRLYIVDTDTGEIRHFPLDGSGGGSLVRTPNSPGVDATSMIRWRTAAQTVPPASGGAPELSIFGMRSLTVPAGTIVRAIGSRAAVIVTRGALTVAGEIDVGAGRVQNAQGAPSPSVPGPGGGRGAIDTTAGNAAAGCAAGGDGSRRVASGNHDTGGGGGGLGTAGGKGGRASPTEDGGGSSVTGAALALACAQTNLVPLRGGSGGGCGEGANDGGGGGGALQLTSFASIAIMDGATLYAGGAGGDGTQGPDGGGGAGAGGAILLEAPAVSIAAASLIASGGGGGAGVGNTLPGEDGPRDGTAAEPTGNGGRGATGANAGAGELLAEDGGGDLDGTGGGGGGAGLVHLRTVAPPTMSGSPTIRPGATTSAAATAD